MDRKLATVEMVKALAPIPGADRIEAATIRGWQCVVKKGEFAAGDLGVYFEIDSFLPIETRYEFLRPSCLRKMLDQEGFRLRTARFKGQLSQGLLLPLTLFPEITAPSPGADVTAFLRVRLYEPPLPANLAGKARGRFPSWIPRSDQERIQNLPEIFTSCRSLDFEVTVKMDGASMTAYWRGGTFGVCSRNLDLLESDDNTLWSIARGLRLRERLSALGRNLALQGEACGESIQRNRDRIQGQRLFVFDIFDIDAGCHLPHSERLRTLAALEAAAPGPPISHVPILGVRPILAEQPNLESLLGAAEGPGFNSPCREGIVCKSIPTPEHPHIVSFKAISNRYLLDYGD